MSIKKEEEGNLHSHFLIFFFPSPSTIFFSLPSFTSDIHREFISKRVNSYVTVERTILSPLRVIADLASKRKETGLVLRRNPPRIAAASHSRE